MSHPFHAPSRAAAGVVCLLTVVCAREPRAQAAPAQRVAVLAVADSALAAITRGDMVAFTDLMLPEATLYPSRTTDGVTRVRARSRAEQRSSPMTARVTERGFRPEVRVDGGVATVWYPYDLYLDGKWSHCGVDVFVMFQVDGGWKIANLSWTAVQPPACQPHPDGPPPR